MKNATKYEPKIKKLLAGAKARRSAEPADEDAPVRVLLRGILQADAEDARADEALAQLEEEFIDLNELRVAQPKEIVEILGKEYPVARRKAEAIRSTLQGVFDRTSTVDVAYMAELPKRELRRHLTELGAGRYAAAYAVLMAFGGHAVCVDDTLAGCLEMDGYVEPGATADEVQGFLERVISQKQARAAHAALRSFAAKRGKALAKKRHAAAEAERKAAEKARKAAEAAAEAARKAAEEQAAREKAARAEAKKKKAAAKRAAKKKEATKKAPAKKKAAKKPAAKQKAVKRPAAKKAAAKKPAAKKAAKKSSVKKPTKKAPAKKSPARKSPAKKTSKKAPAKRPARKK